MTIQVEIPKVLVNVKVGSSSVGIKVQPTGATKSKNAWYGQRLPQLNKPKTR